jgi:hypothetical protein
MMGKEPDPVILELKYNDPTRSAPVKEKVNFTSFRADLDKRSRVLNNYATRGPTAQKLANMPEEQLTQILDRLIRDVQTTHKILTAMDDYFKTESGNDERDKVRGIKPELSTMKNTIVRANQIRHEYTAQKEEEEQMRKLGIAPGVK